ncbi:MAG: DUF6339 family protein, partial [Nitrosopumilus sp.]|nr:DUF6339 family protein [Nitrosopumilus sp.]
MSETLYKLTPDGYNRLWTYARNHPDKYMDPGIKFDDILSEGSTDEPYRIDSGVKITRSLELPPADAKNRHRGDMYCLGFYRSMDGMTPRIASDPMVLAYINHFYLHPYAISRWEHKQNPRETVRSISNHWFSSSRLYLTKWNT